MLIKIQLKDKSADSDRGLSEISKLVTKSRRAVIVTGAGISCNAGIPDFRSENGLYNLVKQRFPDTVVKGKDLFDAVMFSNDKSLKVFLSFISELRKQILMAKSTKTHGFIRHLQEKNKLLRCYTQNIDGLEQQQGLTIGIPKVAKERKSTKIVPLHGDIHSLRCMLCASQYSWTEDSIADLDAGEAPACPSCMEHQDERIRNGRRITGIGCLRPNIVLYGEEHPSGGEISACMQRDIRSNPDLLLIMGTSLKVVGIRKLVRDIAKAVKARDGKVILINATDIGSASIWKDIIDYHIEGDCDEWVADLRDKHPAFFERQAVISDYMRAKKKQDIATKPNKQNSEITNAHFMSPPCTPSKNRIIPDPVITADLDNLVVPDDYYNDLAPMPMTPLSQQTIYEPDEDEEENIESTYLKPIINSSLKRKLVTQSPSPKKKLQFILNEDFISHEGLGFSECN